MSDTWNDIQEFKTKQSSLREKLLKRRKQNEGLVADLTGVKSDDSLTKNDSKTSLKDDSKGASSTSQDVKKEDIIEKIQKPRSPAPVHSASTDKAYPKLPPLSESGIERKLLRLLSDVTLELPLDFGTVVTMMAKLVKREVPERMIQVLLDKLTAQSLVDVSKKCDKNTSITTITRLDHAKITAMLELVVEPARKRRRDDGRKQETEVPSKKSRKENSGGESVESLLSAYSTRERESKKVSDEVQALLSATTAKEKSLVEKFRSQSGPSVMEFCQHGTKDDCDKSLGVGRCKKLHFRKIINKHTDESLGDCSFLNTCFHMDTCKYVHYEIEKRDGTGPLSLPRSLNVEPKSSHSQTTLYPNQWIQCDLRDFDMSVLGKCAVVMADPPWDIHMELPYGTMGDDEMRALDVPALQDDGYLFLWVTGRAMELGRECLKIWGYERIDELIWVKTNQLQRIIRTGRTGHWLNHGKEHCLIGVKGNPRGFNRGLDADVIVAEVRATSHKPDEVYGIIERLAPGMRKVELFGRPHNVQPNWITLGNQLDGVKLLDPEIVRRFKERYPSGTCMPGST